MTQASDAVRAITEQSGQTGVTGQSADHPQTVSLRMVSASDPMISVDGVSRSQGALYADTNV